MRNHARLPNFNDMMIAMTVVIDCRGMRVGQHDDPQLRGTGEQIQQPGQPKIVHGQAPLSGRGGERVGAALALFPAGPSTS